MDSKRDNIRRPVDTLTKEIWQEWFTDFEYWMIGEGIDLAITDTLEHYAYSPTPNNVTSAGSSSGSIDTEMTDTTPPPPTKSADNNKTKGFAKFDLGIEGQGEPSDVILNPVMRREFRAADAKVQFMLSKCIGEFDKEFVKPHTTAKAKWEALKAKYSKVTPTARREDLQQITGFEFGKLNGKPVDMTISSAWSHLVSVRGKIAVANPKLAETFSQETLFEYLLAGLPDSYNVIQQSLEGNTTADVYERLEVLERSELKYSLSAKAETTESAHYAGKDKNTQKHQTKRRNSDEVKCHFCGLKHYRNQCELRGLITEMVSNFKLEKAREEKKSKEKHSSIKRSL